MGGIAWKHRCRVCNRHWRLSGVESPGVHFPTAMAVRTLTFQPDRIKKILVRAPNWVGDAVMCLPALEALRRAFPDSEISVLARPVIGELFVGHPGAHRVVTYDYREAHAGWWGTIRLARSLRRERYDLVVLFQNAFEAALLGVLAGIALRYGYATDGRRWLLTHPVEPPDPKRALHHVQYYLEMLRHVAPETLIPKPVLYVSSAEETAANVLLQEHGVRAADVLIGVNPGSVYGGAKRWLPERFAAAADRLMVDVRQRSPNPVRCLILGGPGEEALGEAIARRMLSNAVVLSGQTSLRVLKAVLKRCCLFVTNDTGPMHVANALGVPVVAVFGSTDPVATAPSTGVFSVVRTPVNCSPCLLRECPIDHRCMTSVSVDQVVRAAQGILAQRVMR